MYADACYNMDLFVADLNQRGKLKAVGNVKVDRPSERTTDNYFSFILRSSLRQVEVAMPGYVRRDLDNPKAFPRLYIGGNSWVWHIALEWVEDALAGV